jgi:hypothetical protein
VPRSKGPLQACGGGWQGIPRCDPHVGESVESDEARTRVGPLARAHVPVEPLLKERIVQRDRLLHISLAELPDPCLPLVTGSQRVLSPAAEDVREGLWGRQGQCGYQCRMLDVIGPGSAAASSAALMVAGDVPGCVEM